MGDEIGRRLGIGAGYDLATQFPFARLHLDDLRPHVREHYRGIGPLLSPGEIQYAYPFERSSHRPSSHAKNRIGMLWPGPVSQVPTVR